ncbi:hypothetical protein ACFP1L_12030 [Lactiplantibacillus nangangensis]|uniref:Uncharacterized protein n=1 Tax=Lactiplantibacillus nangangensis TaxID=2559917 RepID=A0ABW1SLJ1_9LACO|nr:hypothetical protein [Lactiplantibacillus nangangensis]
MELSLDGQTQIYMQLGLIHELASEHDPKRYEKDMKRIKEATKEIKATIHHERYFWEIRQQAFELFGND